MSAAADRLAALPPITDADSAYVAHHTAYDVADAAAYAASASYGASPYAASPYAAYASAYAASAAFASAYGSVAAQADEREWQARRTAEVLGLPWE